MDPDRADQDQHIADQRIADQIAAGSKGNSFKSDLLKVYPERTKKLLENLHNRVGSLQEELVAANERIAALESQFSQVMKNVPTQEGTCDVCGQSNAAVKPYSMWDSVCRMCVNDFENFK